MIAYKIHRLKNPIYGSAIHYEHILTQEQLLSYRLQFFLTSFPHHQFPRIFQEELLNEEIGKPIQL